LLKIFSRQPGTLERDAAMKKLIVVVMIAGAFGAAILMTGCKGKAPSEGGGSSEAKKSAAKVELDTGVKKLSYALGLDLGQQVKTEAPPLDAEVFARGAKDGLSGAEPAMPEEEVMQMLKDFKVKMEAQRRRRIEQLAQENKDKAEAFLAENAKKEGVTILESGLQYEVIKQGEGRSPGPTDVVTVNYRGELLDGSVFDSSYERGKPVTFPLDRVIKGWTEALQLMKVGSKWKLFIPPDLAYGAKGAPGTIGPNALLIFEVELLKVKPK